MVARGKAPLRKGIGMAEAIHDNRVFSLLGFAALLDEADVDLETLEVFKEIIAESLASGGISANEFAQAFGVHPSTISRWATGKSLPQSIVRKVVINWIRDQVNYSIRGHKDLSKAVDNIDKIVRSKLQRVASGG